MKYKITSLTNKIWNIQDGLVEISGIAEILAKNRGIGDLGTFVNKSIKDFLPDPFVFIDMKEAVYRIVDAIKGNQKIAILGDYDVDGISAVSVLIKFLEHIGADYSYLIPSRMDEGYGLNIANIEKYKDYLIIAVDCGSSSVEELAYAKNNHIDVIVIDHHSMSTIPDSFAIINPHRPDEKNNYKYLCATGLVFIYVVGINRQLKEVGFYGTKMEPDLTDYLDLVALATVCDVVDLIELNRTFVQAGLKVIKQRRNLGIGILLSAPINKSIGIITSETISFFLGPRLNAAGRMDHADLSVRLLTTKNPLEAKKIAQQLDALNNERQTLEQKIMAEAVSFEKKDQNFICAYNFNWHIGIIGIIAGRMKEKYNKPTIIISKDSKGIGKASCRSIKDVDISSIIKKGIDHEVIISGGGHHMAAGFSIDTSKINDLLEFLALNIKYEHYVPELYADCIVPLNLVTVAFMEAVSILEPFGVGNRPPKFIIPNVKIVSAKIVKENHISFSIEDKNANSLRAISFRCVGTPLGDILLKECNSVSMLGRVVISFWNDRKYISFQLEDISSDVVLK
ncbi:MAG: single-stranded-DNA-specific exonuclease RecJ [Holosporaceae bacterium]|nr:single-stranded-DNA-specific exonuclease RecJ [Holosporaceae bacterium]